MNILGLIPARGGSKRIPRKNIKMLGELPLIAWTIRTAIASRTCSDIVVSTDDPEIADIAMQFGASFTGLRPEKLATDEASSVEVALYELEQYEKLRGPVDGLLLLQPTSPFRRRETISKAVEHFIERGGDGAMASFNEAPAHPAWCFRLKDGEMQPYFGWDTLKSRSQDLETAYVLNGSIYIISPNTLRNEKTFLPKNIKPIFTDNIYETIDIDTERDWEFAELLLKTLRIYDE